MRKWAIVMVIGLCAVIARAGDEMDPDGDGIPGVWVGDQSGGNGGVIDVNDMIGANWINADVYAIESATGNGTLLGASGALNFNASCTLADGRVIATGGLAVNDIYEIDPNTGLGTKISTSTVNDIRGLTTAPDGTVYAVAEPTTTEDFLYTLNPDTGVMTLIGTTGSTNVQGLAHDSGNTLYGWAVNVGGLGTINKSTGAISFLGGPTTGDIQGIEFGPGGKLYGARTKLYDINTATGAFVIIGGVYTDVRGISAIEVGPPCSGKEAIKKAKCKKGKLKVKTVGGNPGETVTVTADCGSGSATVKANGSATVKISPCAGAGTATAKWDCGASDSEPYNCPA